MIAEIEAMIAEKEVTGRCEMRILDSSGDSRHTWDPARPEEVAAMKKVYDDLKKKSYAAFRVQKENGGRGEQMAEWDPNAGLMLMVPPMVGG